MELELERKLDILKGPMWAPLWEYKLDSWMAIELDYTLVHRWETGWLELRWELELWETKKDKLSELAMVSLL